MAKNDDGAGYKQVKEAIAKYERNEIFLDTLRHHHSKAYMSAAEKHLMDDKGQIILKKLKNREVQDNFADHMADFYLKQAKEVYKANPGDELLEEQLMQLYSGVTRTELKRLVHTHKENLDHDFFNSRLAPSLVSRVRERISEIPYKGLKEEHKNDIIKHIAKESGQNIHELIDTSNMSLEDATRLLETYVKQGGILEKDIEGETFYKKKKKSA